jgi:hypothetical protein
MAEKITQQKANITATKNSAHGSTDKAVKDDSPKAKIPAIKGKFDSSNEMLVWQFKTLLGQIQQIEMHESGDCPCILNTEDPPERCLGKHLLNIATLSRETANMSTENKVWLLKLAGEANARHEQFRRFICHTEELPKLTDWARTWRKQFIEPVYYTCELPPAAGKKNDHADANACKLPAS